MPVCLARRNFSWRHLLLLVWLAQLVWLAWHFSADFVDLAKRLASGRVGEAVRREEPDHLWLEELKTLMPPDSTYIFVDCYEAGNYLATRYRLHPRRMVILNPLATPTRLYDKIKQEQASFLVLRECNLYPQWQFLFGPEARVFQPLPTSGPGLVLRVDPGALTGGFYD